MKKILLVISLLLLAGPAFGATHWVSTNGTAAYSACVGVTPLSGTSACSLATANSSAIAGDLIYLRSGTYTVSGNGIQPTNSGTSSSNMITFQGYPGDLPSLPIISGAQYGFLLYNNTTGNTYISIKNIEFLNPSISWGTISEGGNHNEIAFNTFVMNDVQGAPSLFIGPNSDLKFPTHNWVHGNTFNVTGSANGTEGKGCTDGGGDDIDIGQSGGTYGNTTGDLSNNNTIENNVFNHDPHAAIDGYGEFTVIRNNVFHNEPWSSGCSVTTNYSNTKYSNSAYNGMYAHRDAQFTEDFDRNQTFNLFEGNRYGYASINQDNDGAEDFDLATDGSILRFAFFYASMGACLQFKYDRGSGVGGGGNGGTYNRVYNNTFYDCGIGWPPATEAVGDGCNTSSCPFSSVALSNYDGGTSGSGQGNVLKNNLIYEPDSLGLAMYGGDAIEHSPGGSSPPFSPTNAWPDYASATHNWCTSITTFNSSSFCSAHGNPLFNNPSLSTPSSTTLPDLSLQAGSGALSGGTSLTTATNSGTGSTTLTVADAMYFQDGTWGSDLSRPAAGLGGTMQADQIAIGTVTNIVRISSITYGTYNAPTGTITLASPATWSTNAPIWLYSKSDGVVVLVGSAPNYGAGMQSSSGQAVTPTFSPGAGTYTSSQSVTISTSSSGAVICYNTTGSPATNGSTGCAAGTLYSGPVTVSVSETLFAIAGGTGYTDSNIGSAVYSIPVLSPTATPPAGTYSSAQSVTISTVTGGAIICYTTDGTTPTATVPGTCSNGTSLANGGSISISVTETLQAIGTESGLTNSSVFSAPYIISASGPSVVFGASVRLQGSTILN